MAETIDAWYFVRCAMMELVPTEYGWMGMPRVLFIGSSKVLVQEAIFWHFWRIFCCDKVWLEGFRVISHCSVGKWCCRLCREMQYLVLTQRIILMHMSDTADVMLLFCMHILKFVTCQYIVSCHHMLVCSCLSNRNTHTHMRACVRARTQTYTSTSTMEVFLSCLFPHGSFHHPWWKTYESA